MRTYSLKPFLATFFLAPLLTPQLLPAQTLPDPVRASENLPSTPTLSPAAEDSTSTSRRASLEDENQFAPDTPGDHDIGQQLILKRNEQIESFRVWLNSSAFWTSNVGNTYANELDDWFLTATAGAGWQPRISRRIFGDVYVSQNWYLYDEFDILDYQLGEAAAGVLMVMPELGNSLLHLHYIFQRVTAEIDDDAFYQSHLIRAGIQKTFLINRLNSVNIGGMASFALDTDPSVLQRHEYTALLGYNFKITRALIFNLNYRVTYYDYFNLFGRHDWYQNFGASLTWSPYKYLDLVASYNFALNRSNEGVFDYDTHLAGPSISLRFKF
jgi:hypothetical protein